jgi:putative transposase
MWPLELREHCVQRLFGLNPPTMLALSRETGVPPTTLGRWKEQALGTAITAENTMSSKKDKRPAAWPPAERLRVVAASAGLSDEELGAYLRREGLHAATVEPWRRDALEGLGGLPQKTSGKPKVSRRERELERELHRKEKALAEVAALLVFKKKKRPTSLRGTRGRPLVREPREAVLALIDEAVSSGARLQPCCVLLGLTARTVQRWRTRPEDRRTTRAHAAPAKRLSESERQAILRTASAPRFRDLSPRQIVAQLADEGVYVGSESTVYRVLREHEMRSHRGRARPPSNSKPREKIATGPNQVWSWDITYLRGPMRRQFFHLYMVLDIWSRRIVGWTVQPAELGTRAARLVMEATLREGSPEDLVLHSDRGTPMTSAALMGMLDHLSVRPSCSRPRVSDDNPYSEALFRTVKYRPEYPTKPFDSIEAAQAWAELFVDWYNHEHKHSAMGFVTRSPAAHGRGPGPARARAARSGSRGRPPGRRRRWSRRIAGFGRSPAACPRGARSRGPPRRPP